MAVGCLFVLFGIVHTTHRILYLFLIQRIVVLFLVSTLENSNNEKLRATVSVARFHLTRSAVLYADVVAIDVWPKTTWKP